MNSIWTIDVQHQFKSSVIPCEICEGEPRTQTVVIVDPFGEQHEQYSLCDASECREKLQDFTIGIPVQGEQE